MAPKLDGMDLESVALGAAVTGTLALVTKIATWWMARADRADQQGVAKALEAAAKRRSALDKLRSDLEKIAGLRCRLLVIAVTNGGGVPTRTGPIYSRVLTESVGRMAGDIPPVTELWGKRQADSAYKTFLFGLQQEGTARLVREHMAGALADLYEAQGIEMTMVVMIKETKEAIHYLAINSPRVFESRHDLRVAIEGAVTLLRSTITH